MSVAPAPDFDTTVGDLYAAAANADLWPSALSNLAAVTQSRGALVTSSDHTHRALRNSPSLDDTVSQFFEEGWNRDDLRTARIVARSSRSFVRDQDVTHPREREQSDYYRGFAHAAGVPWFAACALWVGREPVMGISIQRSARQGAFETADLERLRRLEPHLKAAMNFCRTIAERADLARIEGFEQAGVAAFLLSRDGGVCAANALAEAELSGAVTVVRRRLVATDGAAGAGLARLIANATAETDQAGARDLTPVRLARPTGGTLLAQALPLTDGLRPKGAARAILTLSGGVPAGADAEILATAFGLTPTEARVAHHLSRGLDPEEIAAACGLSLGAVRFHLKAILPKAGVRRQSAFVALAAALLRT
ncbi:MAG: response regulator transcription factor [Phenylobacterium sp.]|uniref:helix-turn-helix transcriptional regulator n=1 Tax=Phenylobacterium sp. TaxID=1871053 RepID=UPI001A54FE46|nr:LuxR C-terminal-related transcriptional regulator [Phenylobacterium sp.]MBL8553366.1 response regulator transcription factor [Phenylobacterium sp.]